MDLISIIFLNYNGLNYLKQTIPAALSLIYPNKEIIVFDNGSDDGSVEFLKALAEVRVIENPENLGYSKGKNRAITYAKGEFVLMLDNDILIRDKDILERIVEKYTEETAFIQVPLLDIGKSKTGFYGIFFSIYGVNLHKKKVEIEKILNSKQKTIEIAGATGGCMFFRRKIWDELGGFDEVQTFNLDDIDIGPRAIIYGYRNFLYTKSYFLHLGIVHKQSAKLYANRFKLIFSGHARSMFKNYKIDNLIFHFPFFIFFQFFKSLKYSILKRNIFIFFAFCNSFFRFCKYFKSTLHERKIIQRKRKVKSDDFLKVKVATKLFIIRSEV